MCSACRHPGATLGCFFKSCPYKYHYRCALESGEWHTLNLLLHVAHSMKCVYTYAHTHTHTLIYLNAVKDN